MEKRHYERPKSKVINLRTGSPLLAGSEGTGTSPGDTPGKTPSAKKHEYLWEEEEY
jgi:hypothetical protein